MSQVISFGSGGVIPGGAVKSLTADTGGAILPILGNINLLGDGATTTTAGDAITSTITFTVDQKFAATYTTDDANFAVPVAYNLNIFGGTGIHTTSAGDTVTISTSGIIDLTYVSVNSSPYVVLSTDEYLSVDSGGGAIIIQLPDIVTAGRVYTIKDRTGSAATHNITVTTVGGTVNIDGATTFVINTAYEAINVIGNGSTYEVY